MAMPTTVIPSHCPYCSLQCGIAINPARPKQVQPLADFPTNRGGRCAKGWTAGEFVLVKSPQGETRHEVIARWPLQP